MRSGRDDAPPPPETPGPLPPPQAIEPPPAPEPPPPPEPQPLRVEVIVRGRVQGVGFRMFVGQAAANYGLVGWVRNEPDGSVRAVAEGGPGALEAFARELDVGPPGASVERVEVTWSPAIGGFDRFAIRSGWHSGD